MNENLESVVFHVPNVQSVIFHELMIDRNDDTGDFIAGCLCGWFDDECIGPTDAARRWEAHCEMPHV